MTFAEEVAAKRAKMLAHLEAAHALADEVSDTTASLMIELAVIRVKEDNWPEGWRPQSDQ
jgi:hypothetical protein